MNFPNSDIFLAQLLDSLMGFASVLDPSGNILLSNKVTLDTVGVCAEEARGIPYWDSPWWQFSRQVVGRIHQGVQEAARGKSQRFDVQYRISSGEIRWLDFSLMPIQNSQGEVTHLIASGVDVTRRVLKGQKLQESELNLRQMADAMPQMVWMADPAGKLTYFNKQWLEYTGVSLQEAKNRGYKYIFHPDDLSETLRTWELSLRAGTPFEHEHRVRRASDHTFRWHLARAVPIVLQGQAQGWVGTLTDIHDQKLLSEDLERSRKQLDIILDGVTDGIIVYDQSGRYLFANEAGARQSGASSVEEFLKWKSTDLISRFEFFDEDGNPFPRERLPGQQALQGVSNPPSVVLQFQVKGESERRWAILRSRPVLDPLGQVQFVVSIFRDITERKKFDLVNEKLIRDMALERAQLKSVISQMGTGVMIVEAPSGRAVLVNDKVGEIWMKNELPVDRKERYQALHGCHMDGTSFRDEDWPSYRSIHFGETVQDLEIKIRRGDGSDGYILSSSDPIRDDSSGRVVAAVVTIQDVTDIRRQAQASQFLDEATRLLASSLDYKMTLDHVGQLAIQSLGGWVGVTLLNEEGILEPIVVAHRDPDKVKLARYVRELYPADPQDDSGEYGVLRSGEPVFVPSISDEMLIASARDERHLKMIRELGLKGYIAVPLKTKEGSIGLISFASVDRAYCEKDLALAKELADRASLAIENAKLYSQAQEANRAKTNFLANMSHELRTPLGAVLGYAELLVGPEPLSEKVEYIMAMRRNGNQLLHLINDLLDLSKVESGHLRIESEEFSLAELMKDINSLSQIRAKEKGIVFDFKIPKSLPGTLISDVIRLRQILMNIIGNAIKFTSEGSVSARAEFFAMEGKKGHLRFEISDTGLGISPEQAKGLFQSFVQADSSTTRKFGGTGLGLALSRRLARAMGGDVHLAQSELGKGSLFVIEIEVLQAESSSLVTKEHFLEKGHPSENENARLEGVKILLVEDSSDNQLLIQNYLSSVGADVETANDGLEGMMKATGGAYDVVLMDIQMPQMGGPEAVFHLRKAGYKIPIVAITAHALEEDRKKCFEAGCNEFLTKPVQKAELIETVARFASGI